MTSTADLDQATATPTSGASTAGTVSIMLYGDNALARQEIRRGVGEKIGARGLAVEWTEVATPAVAVMECEDKQFDLIIGDNETGKLGGVGLTRQLRQELGWRPTIMLVLARQQDAWLAAWSGADAAVARPLDPFELRARVTDILQLDDD
ncbi:MAG: hypothetical protein FWD29_00650 [Micrococcales bacterium]|nr:hypothetical protein [Micrococcales bacterium]